MQVLTCYHLNCKRLLAKSQGIGLPRHRFTGSGGQTPGGDSRPRGGNRTRGEIGTLFEDDDEHGCDQETLSYLLASSF